MSEIIRVSKDVKEKLVKIAAELQLNRAIQGSIAISICFYRMKVT